MTNYVALGPRVVLHFVGPTIDGAPMLSLRPGEEFGIEFPNGTITKAAITAASGDTMEITLASGDRWSLTPHREGDAPVRFSLPGLDVRNWVIREKS
jgi:hypothetical protein